MEIYSTLYRKKIPFKPLDGKKVKMFVCGPTVYDDAHIGHGRTYIAFDVIKRYLEFKGFTVFYLQNITDVDDKIIKRAKELGKDVSDISALYEKRFIEDMHSLNVFGVNYFARATDNIAEIIDQIQRLLDLGFAYESDDGVYFEIAKFPEFGKLSNRKIEDLETHREIVKASKKSPNDFALWKLKDDDVVWDSPWGKGRPGWHIEDTAITEYYFGPQYDIHGGGLDLIFPHHEAEITQMEAVSGKAPMVDYWLHTGFLNVSGEKMSKSLKNFITIRDLLEDYNGDVFRFFVLSTHYRSPIDFSKELLHQAEKTLNNLRNFYATLDCGEAVADSDYDKLQIARDNFYKAMDDDFHTPKAISSIFRFINDSKEDFGELSSGDIAAIKEFFDEVSLIFGIDFNKKEELSSNEDLLKIIADTRLTLRKNKQYELSDKIRDDLVALGYQIDD